MSKKKIVLTIVAMIGLSITGCGSALTSFIESDIKVEIEGRAERNKEVAAQFEAIGAISKDEYEKICKNIDKNIKIYIAEAESKASDTTTVDSKALTTLAQSVSWIKLGASGTPAYIEGIDADGKPVKMYWTPEYDSDGKIVMNANGQMANTKYYASSEWTVYDSTITDPGNDKNQMVLPNFIISNYLYANYYKGLGLTNTPGTHEYTVTANPNGDNVTPIDLISDEVGTAINEAIQGEVYVLRPDMLNSTGEATLDGALAKIKTALDSNDTKGLMDYFEPALDANGNNVKLVPDGDASFNIVDESKPNLEGKDEPGYDLIIKQYETEVMHVRFNEFNQEAINQLNKLINTATGSVRLIKDDNSSWKVFVVEYPIQMIDKMKNNGNNVDVTFKNSGVGINIATGQFVKYNKVNNKWDTSTVVAVTADDYYLTTAASQNNDAEGISSLVLKGYATSSITDMGGTKHEFTCGRIVFRDYLEATFAPEFVDGENLVAFGRKIRFKMDDGYWKEGSQYNNTSYKQMVLRYPKGENIAYFVDKDGNKNAQSTNLQITDFCSYKPLTKKKYKNCSVTRLSKKSETTSETKKTYKSGSVPKQSELKQKVLGDDGKSISPTLLFPGNYIGKVDYTNDSPSLQRFPCITTTKGLFDSALFSDWINLESSTASLSWWQTYLSSNGYSYEITNEAVNEYLNSNYKYELSQNGIIILDLEVVAKIQEQYDEESALQKTSNIRTMFMVLGWFIIAYAMILMLAWVFDTNSDFGVKLLGKLTFGNWVAIMYEDDMPYNNANEQTFLTAGKLFLRCIIIIVVGIVLIRINIFNVIYVLIDIFGGAASEIEKVISGFK